MPFQTPNSVLPALPVSSPAPVSLLLPSRVSYFLPFSPSGSQKGKLYPGPQESTRSSRPKTDRKDRQRHFRPRFPAENDQGRRRQNPAQEEPGLPFKAFVPLGFQIKEYFDLLSKDFSIKVVRMKTKGLEKSRPFFQTGQGRKIYGLTISFSFSLVVVPTRPVPSSISQGPRTSSAYFSWNSITACSVRGPK